MLSMTRQETIAVLDWILAAACLAVTAEPCAGSLDDALADHFNYLRRQAPLAYVAVMGLLEPADQLMACADPDPHSL